MERKWAFVIAGLLGGLLTLGLGRLIGGEAAGTSASAEREAAELRRLKQQVRELEASVAGSERLAREAQVTARAAQAAVGPRVETSPAPERGAGAVEPAGAGSPSAEGADAVPPEPTPEEVVARLDARFFGEEVDAAWSRDALPRAERLGVLLPRGARVVSLECRSSMCRLEMSHPSLESFQGFVREALLGTGNPWDGAFMASLKGNPALPGGVQAVAWLARAGVELTPDAVAGP
ncbi:hypothetical protein HPC49_08745 [Pyxidicoccus fallax]|uniref:Uncharacterized protein n=1 Tax=Pyxidicoccus fallax TaxID=394095 RepID=A0A848L494_9BACT|nr:hypothetical protein [Pyxidicoccus fallax]NMO13436.1 hypothetical protein [Pyxidicoccus fallax]NPC78332.1 hypothetical protein [Pyxidicoccus fallax]